MCIKNLYLLIFISFFCVVTRAQKIVELQKNTSHYELTGDEIFFIEDATCRLTIEDILANKLNEFKAITGKKINNGFSLSNYWFIVKFKNNQESMLKRFIEINRPNLDNIELYELINRHEYKLISKTGDNYKFKDRPINHRNFIFQINFYAGEERTFLLMVNNGGEQFHFSINLWSEKSLNKRDYFEQYFFGMYFGIILFVLIFNIFLFFSLKEALNIYYVLYILSLGLLQMSLNGHAFEILWPENTYMANRANPLFASTGVLFLLLFAIDFLRLKKYAPKSYKIFNIFKYVILICAVFSIIPGKFFYLFSVWGINAFTLLLNIFILPVSYQVIKKGFYAARIFFTAFVVLVLSVFAFILNNFGILPSNIITGYGLQFGSAIEVIMLSLAIVQRIKQFRDDSIQKLKEINILKQKDNEILEIKVKERMATILEQKEIIEKNNLKITDSITYAKRIQSAILPGPEEMQKLLKQSFVFYLPKDIVSGDFYFVEPVRTNSGKELISFVVGDCTGHGVPGGFLTMLCSSFLKQSLTQYEVNSPGQALDFVNKSLKNHLKQTHPDIILRDGMDAAFCVLDKNEMKLYYAGANRSLIIVRNNQLTEIKPDKQSIGASDDIRPFTDHCIPIQHNDMIYLTSDGYADQFGGTDGKKFKNSALKKLFVEISELKINEQETILKQRFFDWKKNREQIDDVCVLGVRI